MGKKPSDITNYLRLHFNNEHLNSISEQEFLNCRYLDLGYIDSFEIIHLIVDIERTFNIVIDPSDTESDKFRVFKGLVEIIQSKL
jgi:acyl carrier protein